MSAPMEECNNCINESTSLDCLSCVDGSHKRKSNTSKPVVRKYDAPNGYTAILMPESARDNCSGCAFARDRVCGVDRLCAPQERQDKHAVIFVEQQDE